MWTWHWHSADPVRGARAQSVPQCRSLDAGYGTDPHPSSVACLADGPPARAQAGALARQKVRMPRSSRGCSFVRCEEKSRALCRQEDGRVNKFAEKMDTRPRPCSRRTHTRCEGFGAGGADSSLIGHAFRDAYACSAAWASARCPSFRRNGLTPLSAVRHKGPELLFTRKQRASRYSQSLSC